MLLLHATLLVFLSCFANGFPSTHGIFDLDPTAEWGRVEKLISGGMPRSAQQTKFWKTVASNGSSQLEPIRVEEYVRVPVSKDHRNLFKPAMGVRVVPQQVKDILMVTQRPAVTGSTPPSRPKQVEVLCHIDRIYVRIRRNLFHSTSAPRHLKLGTCGVNYDSPEYFFHLYLLETNCGWKRESKRDEEVISVALHYSPDASSPIVREPAFSIPIVCKYHRTFHSYKIGFHPKLEGGTIYRHLQSKSSYSITPQDAMGNELVGGRWYTLGQPMFFVAKQVSSTAPKVPGQRLYINKCFMTASHNSSSTPKYTVIDNQGCMIDSKATTQSKFLRGDSSMVQMFQIGSFIFKDMAAKASSPSQLYMHCEMTVGSISPSPSLKACNYDPVAKKWKELYSDSGNVCNCCNTQCSPAQPKAARNLVSSHSWDVDFSSKEGFAEIVPQVKSIDTVDPQDHQFFDWEEDY